MSGLDYITLQKELGAALGQLPPPYNVMPPDFDLLLPRAIEYAEGRICGEIPLLANRTQNTSLGSGVGSRQIDLTGITPPVVVLEGVSLVTPTGAVSFDKATLDFIDLFWPLEATTMDPAQADNIGRFWAMRDATVIVLAPTPSLALPAVLTGLFQPTSISATNPTTYLSETYPSLLVAGSMLFLEGTLKRNFGAQSDDPRQALSWEAQYITLRDACSFEEARRRGLTPNIPRPPQSKAA